MSLNNRNKLIITQAFLLLQKEQKTYSQRTIGKKMGIVGYKLAPATISHLANLEQYEAKGNNVGNDTLAKAAEGLQVIIKSELCLEFDNSARKFVPITGEDCQPVIIEEDDDQYPPTAVTYKLHQDGRRSVQDKLKLYRSAQKEVVEMGVRLNSFSLHFTHESDQNFRQPVLDCMRNGVNFKCYVIKPNSRYAQDYFTSRAKIQKRELEAWREIDEIIERLKTIRDDLNAHSNKGKMSLSWYNTYPYFHASVADGDAPTGFMYASPYLLGVRRANCPVLEIQRSKDRVLFNQFWRSTEATISQSKLIT